jgi:hypothetical protein
MTPTPKFFRTIRNGKVALWVTMPNGESCNIWDISPAHDADEVLAAVAMAFSRGCEFMEMRAAEAPTWGAFEKHVRRGAK